MNNQSTFDFESFALSNKPKEVTALDYLRAVYKSKDLHDDFLLYFSRLMWPEFIVIDSKVYIKELFDIERYRSLISNADTEKTAHYWMNLLELTGMFDGLTDQKAQEIAALLCNSWNAKIKSEFKSTDTVFNVIADQNTGEVFLGVKDC